jgi:16S rRNA (adenine1518-N6/adenine1519-N6)-dimethyltransferase
MSELNPALNLRQLLRDRGHAPRKSLGQNFLISRHHLDQIADEIAAACSAGGANPPRGVVEIGAGPGNLTRALLDRGLSVYAYELDRSFEPWHAEAFGAETAQGRFHVDYRDALRANPAEAVAWLQKASGAPEIVLAGNIPYQITSPLIYQALRWTAMGFPVSAIVILAQDDVVHRALASPGDPEYGALPAKIGALAQGRSPVKVPPSAFWPQPKVRSALLTIEPRPLGERPAGNVLSLAWSLIDIGFQQRRKTLAKTLSLSGEKAPERDKVESWLEKRGFSTKARPEELASAEWLELARFLLTDNGTRASENSGAPSRPDA